MHSPFAVPSSAMSVFAISETIFLEPVVIRGRAIKHIRSCPTLAKNISVAGVRIVLGRHKYFRSYWPVKTLSRTTVEQAEIFVRMYRHPAHNPPKYKLSSFDSTRRIYTLIRHLSIPMRNLFLVRTILVKEYKNWTLLFF